MELPPEIEGSYGSESITFPFYCEGIIEIFKGKHHLQQKVKTEGNIFPTGMTLCLEGISTNHLPKFGWKDTDILLILNGYQKENLYKLEGKTKRVN